MSEHARVGSSPVILGCMGLGGPWEAEGFGEAEIARADAAIGAALDSGITAFDHADIYSRGKAEAAFGAALARSPGLRDKIFVQTKCGIRPAGSAGWASWNAPTGGERPGYDPARYDLSEEWIRSSVEASLRRLRTDRIDRLLLHRPDPLMDPSRIAEAFARLRAEGKVLGFGVSNFSAGQAARVAAALAVRGLRVEANQVELSLVHHDLVEAGISVNQRGWAPEPWRGEFDGGLGSGSSPTGAGALDLAGWCDDRGAELQAWGCLAQGRLSGRSLPPGAPPALAAAAAAVARVAEERGESPEAVALAWLLALPRSGAAAGGPLVRPVAGSSEPARIARCGRAAGLRLSREEWYYLYEAARGAAMP